jgi:hypothetical protein
VEHHRRTGQVEDAWRYLRMAEAEYADEWNGPPQLLALREGLRAMLQLDGGRPDAARQTLARALRLGSIARDMPIMSRLTIGVARYARAVGDPELATRLLGAAEEMLGAVDRSDLERRALMEDLGGLPEYESWYAAGKNGARQENQVLLAHTVGLAEEDLGKVPAQTLRP